MNDERTNDIVMFYNIGYFSKAKMTFPFYNIISQREQKASKTNQKEVKKWRDF